MHFVCIRVLYFFRTWSPPDGLPPIDLATCNGEQIVVACKEHLVYLTINEDGLKQERYEEAQEEGEEMGQGQQNGP